MYYGDPESRSRIPEVYPRHRAYLDEFARGAEIWMIGAFLTPGDVASMAIFRSREAAERFIRSDPFVIEGLVARTELRDWDPLTF